MNAGKKVIGYVCDVPIKGTDVVITKDDQRMRIVKYAQKENLNLVGIYEDADYQCHVLDREGVKKLMERCGEVDAVLVERIWCFSRKRAELEPLLARLDEKGVTVQTTSYLWDCLSQQIRHRYMGKPGEVLRDKALAACGMDRRETKRAA